MPLERSKNAEEWCFGAGLDYTGSMPTNRPGTHEAVDRSFYDTIKRDNHFLNVTGKKRNVLYSNEQARKIPG